MAEKKETQVSFRVDSRLASTLQAWAHEEDLKVADLARQLVKLGTGLLEKEGSLHTLRMKFREEMEGPTRKTKRA